MVDSILFWFAAAFQAYHNGIDISWQPGCDCTVRNTIDLNTAQSRIDHEAGGIGAASVVVSDNS